MNTPDPVISRVNELLKVVGDSLTKKDFVDAFEVVLNIVLKMREELSGLNQQELADARRTFADHAAKLSSGNAAQAGSLQSRVEAALRDQERGMNFVHDKVQTIAKAPGPAGRDGRDGIDGRDGQDGSPDTAEEVRDKLETLEGDERLDASSIKNLPELVERSLPIAPMTGSFHQLGDVDMSGIVSGQSITWDGIKWVPYTPAGSGGTPVWGEDLTSQGPGTTFTLAHTPITGTVRVFRGGAYQSVQEGDYSISGATITLSAALAQGEVLVADYSH